MVSFGVWVMVAVKVRVSTFLGSDQNHGKFRIIAKVRVRLGLGFGFLFDRNNLLDQTITTKPTLTLNPTTPN